MANESVATATALFFFSCAVEQGFHALAALRVALDGSSMAGMSMPWSGWEWPSSVWDVFTAVVAVYYWSLRRNYGLLLSNGGLYADPGQQRRLDEGRYVRIRKESGWEPAHVVLGSR